jgi:hypothetical protein
VDDRHPILALLEARTDLAGLPLRRGEACRLTASAATHLAEGAAALRGKTHAAEAVQTVLAGDPKRDRWLRAEAVGVLMQVLMAEAAGVREVLAEQLSCVEGRTATEALAQLALFDLHPRVRERAVVALATRPAGDYRASLLKGFEHPWPAVADHAAEALIALQAKDAAPALVRLLDRPDPRATYQKAGGTKTFIKELVRVNHLQNCLLCHPPSSSTDDTPRGRVPSGENLAGYYGGTGGTFVRADITYLKQDFSVALPVGRSGVAQRFDFFVRERVALPSDILESSIRNEAGPSEQHKAVFFALRELTDRDLGHRVADWKEFVGSGTPMK